jgi:hypothetical protein
VGRKFGTSLMTPIAPSALLSLVQAGYRADFIFRVCVTAVNGIYNRSAQRLSSRSADPRFNRLLDLFERIQGVGGMGMRIERKGEKEVSVFSFRRDLDATLAEDVAAALELMGLDPQAREFSLVYGSLPKDGREIAIVTRSMLQISGELAAYVDVPKSHVDENRASKGVCDEEESLEEARTRVRIRSSVSRPNDAFVSVQYRDHWFYIDDRDFLSKRMFSFLLFLFTLAETGAPDKEPVVTIPAG